MFLCIGVGCDCLTSSLHTGISICVGCVPVSIDEVSDCISAELVELLRKSQLRCSKACVDQQIAVLSGQDRMFSTGDPQDTDVATHGMYFDRCLSRRIDHRRDNTLLVLVHGILLHD